MTIGMSAARALTEAEKQTAEPSVVVVKPRRMASRIGVTQWRLIAFALFLVLWHLASIPAGRLLLPSPIDIIPAFIDEVRSGVLLSATLASLGVFLAGYLLAAVTG